MNQKIEISGIPGPAKQQLEKLVEAEIKSHPEISSVEISVGPVDLPSHTYVFRRLFLDEITGIKELSDLILVRSKAPLNLAQLQARVSEVADYPIEQYQMISLDDDVTAVFDVYQPEVDYSAKTNSGHRATVYDRWWTDAPVLATRHML